MSSDPIDEKRTGAAAIFGVLACAFALRAAYVVNVRLLPWNDMGRWDAARLAILHGSPYTAGWTPLYPAILALATKLFGEGYAVLYLANALFSTLTCLYVYLCAKEVFGRRAAYLSLAISAVYIDTIWYCGVMMAETLGALLLTIAVYRVIKNRNFALTGAVFGLACMTKGLFMLALPAFLFWVHYKYETEGWLKKAALFSAFVLLTIIPWSIRNFTAYKEFVPLEPSFGCTVFDGHNPYTAGGGDALYIGHEYAAFYTDPAVSITEREKICLKKAVEFAINNPLRELELPFIKSSKQLTFTTSFLFYRSDFPARKAMFFLSLLENMLIFPLCVLGLAFSFRDRNAAGFAAMIAVFVGFFITLFGADVRKRLPFVPFMLILAAHGAVLLPGLLERLRRRDTEGIAGRLAVSAAVSALLYLNFAYQVLTRWRDVAGRFN